MIRLFVAVPLPEEVRRRLVGLNSGLKGARWVAEENMHITLRFIGQVDETGAGDIDQRLGEVRAPAFDLALAGLGCFESGGRGRSVWAGVGKSESLAYLRDKVESAVVRAGLEPEGRKFKPHITLARFKKVPSRRLAPMLAEHGGFSAGPFLIDRFVLLQSHLSHKGAAYEELAGYPLQRG